MILAAIKVATGVLALVAAWQLHVAHKKMPDCRPLQRGALALVFIAALQFADAVVRTFMV